MTGYAIVRHELTEPAASIRLLPDQCGIALDIRHQGRPVGFAMHETETGALLSAEQLQQWAGAAADPQALAIIDNPPESTTGLPSVTVAICTKDHPDLLRRCLDSLLGLEAPAHYAADILVVDNASATPETRHVAEATPGVRYIREDKTGLNFARNRALAEARGEILAFVDDDAVVDPGWLLGLLQAWRRAPGAKAFAGQTLPYELRTPAQLLVERIGGFRKGFVPVVHGRDPTEDTLYPVTTVFGNGCNMAFSVEAMRALGGFDIALDTGRPLPGGGDLDALYSIARAGHPVSYEPRMLAFHQHRPDMPGLRRQIRRSWGTGTMAWLCKIRSTDPEMAGRARQMIRWWLKDMLRSLRPGRPRGAYPWRLRLLELVGALEGLTGAYTRSRRRTAAIEAGHARN